MLDGQQRALLNIDSFTVEYGKLIAVKKATMSLAAGEVHTIIGPNSAGKSSLLTSIACGGSRERRVQGTAELDGVALSSLSISERRRRGLRFVPEFRGIFPSLSVRDNLRLGTDAFHVPWDSAFSEARGLFPEVFDDRISAMAGNLSGGEQQMLALGRALIGDPQILLLDEPRLGLAAGIAKRLKEAVVRISQGGVAVVIADQTLGLWSDISNVVHTLIRGQLSEPVADPSEIERLARRAVVE